MKPIINHVVIVYDGDCVFCSRSMAWVARHDDLGLVRFAASTSPFGAELMRQHGIDPKDPSTFLAVIEGRGYVRSDAMLRVVALLDRPARLLGVFRLVPSALRDRVYDEVARNRRLIVPGACPAPSDEMRRRILA